TYPSDVPGRPYDWSYYGPLSWPLEVAGARTPLVLFDPGADAPRLAFTRIGDTGRRGLFRLGVSAETGHPVFHLELPVYPSGGAVLDYTASLVVQDRVRARLETITGADAIHVRLRGIGLSQVLHVTLMEDDGTSWTNELEVDSLWHDYNVPLVTLSAGRGALLPEGFPGEWNYWVSPAAGRGGPGDHPRLDHLERLQLSLRREPGASPGPGQAGVEIEAVTLTFGGVARADAR
ncbi:MAG TPA: hypothetical protein VGI92_04955, partial [Gemmatimonadales bacterium]